MRWIAVVAIMAAFSGSALAKDTIDRTMGNWEGEWKNNDGEGGKLTAKIAALGNDSYKGVFTAHFGKVESYRVEMKGKREGSEVHFGGKVDLGSEKGGVFEWTGNAADGKFAGQYKGPKDVGSFAMTRVEKQSPTLGAKPPEGAVVLFDGTNFDHWTALGGGPVPWKLADGAMEVQGATKGGKATHANIVSKEKFKDMQLHLEFRTPFMPQARGQARGNSGVYLQGLYKVQVLDSFGQPPRDNEAGGIYKVATPKENGSLPPGEWQTYDITFRAARVDQDGKMTEPAVIHVVYNGVVVHDHVKAAEVTPGGVAGKLAEPGPLLLQDHGNPVQYRNIWVLPVK